MYSCSKQYRFMYPLSALTSVLHFNSGKHEMRYPHSKKRFADIRGKSDRAVKRNYHSKHLK